MGYENKSLFSGLILKVIIVGVLVCIGYFAVSALQSPNSPLSTIQDHNEEIQSLLQN